MTNEIMELAEKIADREDFNLRGGGFWQDSAKDLAAALMARLYPKGSTTDRPLLEQRAWDQMEGEITSFFLTAASASPAEREHAPNVLATAENVFQKGTEVFQENENIGASEPVLPKEYWQAWARKRLEIQRKHWVRAAKAALAGDTRELRNRVELSEASPVDIVQSDDPPITIDT